MKAIYSSETSADFQRITQPYIPEDETLHVSYDSEIGIAFMNSGDVT
jgi:hypothetical protein